MGPNRRPIILPAVPEIPKLPELDKFIILGVCGSRRRNNKGDKLRLQNKLRELHPQVIVTGDCKRGADKWARYLAPRYGIKLIVYDAQIRSGMTYNACVKAYYKRNDMVAKTATHLYAQVHKSRTGGTEHTIRRFKKHHPDWESKLFIE